VVKKNVGLVVWVGGGVDSLPRSRYDPKEILSVKVVPGVPGKALMYMGRVGTLEYLGHAWIKATLMTCKYGTLSVR
jgi:hypothetical protein